MVIKAIFFDMDETLVYFPISPVQFLMKTYQGLGLYHSLEQITIAYEEAGKWWNERFPDYELWTRETFIEYNYKLLEILGTKGDLQKLAEIMQTHWENYPEEADERLYPEVRGVLETLSEKGIILGILSNRLLISNLKSLKKHNINAYFQCVICPDNAGARKSENSPQIWQCALNKVGVKPNEALHVDDNYELISGARQAGIQTVLIDRKGICSHVTDCLVIHDLTDIFKMLD